MNDKSHQSERNDEPAQLSQHVGRQAERKLKARRQQHKALWLGFSVTGLVGWGVVIPALLGLAAGIWIDSHYPHRPRMHCWTLMLFSLGIFIGCLNAWYWISREFSAIRREEEEQTEEVETGGKKNE